jgi:glycosyltransferase involved in cell wall biosynthesis
MPQAPKSNNTVVSVVMPTFNSAGYIAEAIESVLAQTYRHWEIIVVDDGSTDDTRAVLAPYSKKITYLRQDNCGVSAARNLAIKHARGELFAFLDADDVWYPEKLILQVQAFNQYPEAGLSFTNHLEFDGSGVCHESGFDERIFSWIKEHKIPDTEFAYGWIYRQLLVGNGIHTSSIVVKREAVEQVGMFDEAFKICQDHDLWLRIAKNHPVIGVNEVLCGYRFHSDGLSGSNDVRMFRWQEDSLRVLEKHLRNGWIPSQFHSLVKTTLGGLCWAVGWNYFRRNRFKEARSLFLEGVRYKPLQMKQGLYGLACFLPVVMVENLRRVKRRVFVSTQAR